MVNTLLGLRYSQFWQRHGFSPNVHYALTLLELAILLFKGLQYLCKGAGGGSTLLKIANDGNGAVVSLWSVPFLGSIKHWILERKKNGRKLSY
jgi:hypothetical protein